MQSIKPNQAVQGRTKIQHTVLRLLTLNIPIPQNRFKLSSTIHEHTCNPEVEEKTTTAKCLHSIQHHS